MNKIEYLKNIKNYLYQYNVKNLSLTSHEIFLKDWFFYEIEVIDNLDEIRLLINKLFLILKNKYFKSNLEEICFKIFGFNNYNIILNIYNMSNLNNYLINIKPINEIIEIEKRQKFFHNFKIYKTTFQEKNLKRKNKKVKEKFAIKNIFFNSYLSNGEMWNYLNILNLELTKISQILMIDNKKIGNNIKNIFIETNSNKLSSEKDYIIKYLIKELFIIIKKKNKKFYNQIEQNILNNKKEQDNLFKIKLFNDINFFLNEKHQFKKLNNVFNENELILELKKVNELIKENNKLNTQILSILLYAYNLLTKEKLNYKKWIYLYYLREITHKENIKDINNLKVIEQSFIIFLNKKIGENLNIDYLNQDEINNEYKDWCNAYLPKINKVLNS